MLQSCADCHGATMGNACTTCRAEDELVPPVATSDLTQGRPPGDRNVSEKAEVLAGLHRELQQLKLSQLKRRASAEFGVETWALEEADDSADVKSAVIDLILSNAERKARADGTTGLTKVRKELQGMKLSAIKKRAKEAGVDPQALEDADDEDDIQAAVIRLILDTFEPAHLRPGQHATKVHTFGHVGIPATRALGQRVSQEQGNSLFGRRHIMVRFCHECAQLLPSSYKRLL
eukprot:SAG11_NODE_10_length_27955_cov_15.365235_9_plen_233_part_00